MNMMKKGQSFLEYALLLGCVAMTLFAMQTYFKRGIQGIVKSTSDDLGAPVLAATGLDAQIEGARSKGEDPFFDPTTITANQEILTNEFASGDRRFVINQDRRVVDSGSRVTIPAETYIDDYSVGLSAGSNMGSGYTGSSNPFGGSNGFGGGGANGLKGPTKVSGGGKYR